MSKIDKLRVNVGIRLENCDDCTKFDEQIKFLANHSIKLSKELKQKDQRIAELEKDNAQLEYRKSYWYNSYDEIRNKYNKNQQEKRTAVKEFIDFAIEKFSEVDDLGDFKYYLDNAEFKYVIKDLLKEMKGE